MIRYTSGFKPIVSEGDAVPTLTVKESIPTLPTVEEAKALAASRAAQVLDYSRQKGAQSPLKEKLRTDGPTLEQWTDAGYQAKDYPPLGYAELDSPALIAYKAKITEASSPMSDEQPVEPHSVNEHQEAQT